ncbi:hypothetical protein KCTC52924_00989 [Arenibacter antarcticus]|uniref:Uncharacterized protein n=1 Tax=Arenibacter antarcticus TaxID=2040469 RepID=A0ABW5VEK4_9FLAO|nr:hypothetical protein [Arenibacter sp. H213]MCM4167512.1 hypothetical protein [Arenibacter sp. H213]
MAIRQGVTTSYTLMVPHMIKIASQGLNPSCLKNKKMNNSMTLISVLLVLAVVIPFLVLNSSGKGEAKTIANRIKEFAKEAHLKFDQKESWGNRFIAIDKTRKILVFSRIVNGEVVINEVPMDQVEKSTIQKATKMVKTNSGKENVLQKLDLEITYFAHHEKALLLNFYDIDQIYTEDYELKRAEKWNVIINEVATTSSVGKIVA